MLSSFLRPRSIPPVRPDKCPVRSMRVPRRRPNFVSSQAKPVSIVSCGTRRGRISKSWRYCPGDTRSRVLCLGSLVSTIAYFDELSCPRSELTRFTLLHAFKRIGPRAVDRDRQAQTALTRRLSSPMSSPAFPIIRCGAIFGLGCH
jgi:hypothetical protein